MDKVFKYLFKYTMKFYVDDIIIKSTIIEDHPQHIEKALIKVQQHNMKVNPKDFFFVSGEKFLIFMTPIVAYLAYYILPNNQSQKNIKEKKSLFTLFNEALFRRDFLLLT